MSKQLSVDEFLVRIRKKCEGKGYIFRGTPHRYSSQTSTLKTIEGTTTEVQDGINSSLYRDLRDKVLFHDEYRPCNAENEILQRARRIYPDGTSKKEIMTDLQHFRGKTNLIDFSRSLYIALFFACDGEHHKKLGELIILDPSILREEKQWVIRTDPTPCLIEPAKTKYSRERVLFQRSVFVYPSYGYIDKELCLIEEVPANLKQPILDHLREFHGMHTNSIYNDLIGFIANEKNHEISAQFFYEGVDLSNKGDHKGAIEKHDKAIELDANYAVFHGNRGLAKLKLGLQKGNLNLYHESIVDCTRAIQLDKNYAEAYHIRGSAGHCLALHESDNLDRTSLLKGAIVDYSKAIDLDPNNAVFRQSRGLAYRELGRTQEADEDLNMAIKLKSGEQKV